MKKTAISKIALVCLCLAWGNSSAFAEDTAKLREALRTSMMQVRDLQNKVATLEAQDADKALTIQDLETKLSSAQKRMVEDKAMADRAIALLQEKNQELEAEIGKLSVALEKWKASHKEAAALAQKTETLRSKLAREKVELERIVADQRTKNHEMFKAATEILDRYKNHSLGDAILAREPFAGNMRAKIQTLAQDLGEKLAEQRIRPGNKPSPPTADGTVATQPPSTR